MAHDDDQRQKREAALHVLRVAQQQPASAPSAADLGDAVQRFAEEAPRTVAVTSLDTLRGGPARRSGGFKVVRPQAEAPDPTVVQPFPPRKGE